MSGGGTYFSGRRRLPAATLVTVVAWIFIVTSGGHQHTAVALDDRQQVVKIMGNPSGEAAHGFHFLSLKQLPLQLFAICYFRL